jgi:hypothetical protein
MFGMFGAFNPRFYPKIANQSIGRTIGFILVFVLIISACVSIKYTALVLSGFSAANKWVGENMGKIAAEFPVVSMDKGSITEPKQTFIKDYDKKFAFIIEPDPVAARAMVDKFPNLALLTQKLLIVKQTKDGGSSEIKNYNMENSSFTITPDASGFKVIFQQKQFELKPQTVKKWLGVISMFVFPALLIIGFAIYSFTKPLQIFVFSLASLIISSITNAKLPYKQLWNIGAYALVPSTCLAAFMDIIGLRPPFFALLYCILYITFLFIGIKAVNGSSASAKA